jgi:cytochrome c peroxidase
MRFRISIVFLLLSGIVLWDGCKEDNPEPINSPTPYEFPQIDGFPTILNIPEDNPTTVEGVRLGRYLFYDGRLSGRTHPDSLMSCATCHKQEYGFDMVLGDPRFPEGRPSGLTGLHTHHHVLPIVNQVYNHEGYFWSGFVREGNIESIVGMTITAEDEIDGEIERTVDLIGSISAYPPLFEEAFGTSEVNYDRISKAIAQFTRTIISSNSRFHRYVRGQAVLSEAEIRGLNLFYSEDADCFHCHGGVSLMTSNLFYNNGKDTIFTDPFDRFSVTSKDSDVGAYKAPSLINCEIRAPYMHDGRFETLEEVIDFYSEGLVYSPSVHPLMKQVNQGGVQLTQQEKDDLIAFLKTLTDHELLTDPALAKPEAMPGK